MAFLKSAGGVLLAVLTALAALLYNPVKQQLTVFGVFRPQDAIINIHGTDSLKIIDDTVMCEDIHHHRGANLLFTACENDPTRRYSWFPPLGSFGDPDALSKGPKGGFTVIDPVTLKSTPLELIDFPGPLVTHGIDLYTPPNEPDTVYIFAVNHLPNPPYYAPPVKDAKTPDAGDLPKARSQIEIFRHTLGSTEAQHLRSIQHSMIRTPNDIVAVNQSAFYFTNDHYYRSGLLRTAEDMVKVATWTDTVYVHVTDTSAKAADAGFTIKQALQALHNNNGLAHGSPRLPQEILAGDATGGVMTRLRRSKDPMKDPGLEIVEHIQLDSNMDNPSYYEDLYATPGRNASGYVVAGLARGMVLEHAWPHADKPIPTLVWHVRANGTSGEAGKEEAKAAESHKEWKHNLIFQDDGRTLRSVATAVLVGIDPRDTDGVKYANLFATGFVSNAVVAAKVRLE
ncbi:MAG: hypothetical protein M1831_002123 [Alyxoria varia]|nr:MAG: hypothetical protein M1831_002123 [Alyxoria varia]